MPGVGGGGVWARLELTEPLSHNKHEKIDAKLPYMKYLLTIQEKCHWPPHQYDCGPRIPHGGRMESNQRFTFFWFLFFAPNNFLNSFIGLFRLAWKGNGNECVLSKNSRNDFHWLKILLTTSWLFPYEIKQVSILYLGEVLDFVAIVVDTRKWKGYRMMIMS